MLQLIVKHDSIEVNSFSAPCAKIRHRRKEGDMARIRVDTEELKNKAEDFAAAADSVGRAGDEILAVALALPSYEGQLSGPARAAGYEIQRRARDMQAALAGDADLLDRSAADFAAVDHRTVAGLSKNQEMLLAAGLPDGASYSGGTSYLGYKYVEGDPPAYILCMYGVCRKVIVTDSNKDAIQEFIRQIDGGTYTDPKTGIQIKVTGYYEAKKEFDKATWTAIGADVAIILGGIAIATGVGTGVGIGGVAGGIILDRSQQATIDQAEADMAEATNNAAAAWNEIFPGSNQEGDPDYSITDPGPGAGKPVYDPPETPISSETPEPG
jgi:hypothetical protein